MPGRRSFLIGCGSFVAAPALGGAAQPAAVCEMTEAVAPAVALEQPAIESSDLAFHIEGWHLPSDTQPDDGKPTISVNSSWQATWR